MSTPNPLRLAGLLAVTLLLAAPCSNGEKPESALETPRYGDEFWTHWGDGQAEVAGYDLSYPRYGALREGTAVAIFVTESFANSLRVKHERADRADADVFPVLKLNLVQDFPTGVYDYNVMTSAFVALEPVNGRPAGLATKVSFSSQEWCGHVYAQTLFDEARVRLQSHSYFDGEADRTDELAYPADGIAEDSLLLWARGLAAPALPPGGSVEARVLRSLEIVRLRHVAPEWEPATLTRSARPETVRVPAGEFEADVLTAEIAPGSESSRTWTFWVEREAPHRLVRWTRDDGLDARLLAGERMKYWSMNGPGLAQALDRLGLSPRPARTP